MSSRNESFDETAIVMAAAPSIISRRNNSSNVVPTPAPGLQRNRTRTNLFTTPGPGLDNTIGSKAYSTTGRIQIIIGDGASVRGEEGHGTRLENRLKMKDLETLKHAFDINKSPDDQPLQLARDEFISFLSTHLNKGTEREYEELFDSIDVTQTGTVDWEKIVSYLMIMLYESDDRLKAFSIPNFKPIKPILNKHRDSIRRIEFIKNINRYITISKEGSCCLYDKNANLLNTARIHAESCKAKDLWITDFVILQNVNKVVLALTTKEIAIYEMTTKMDFNCVYRITHLAATALCLDYWFDPDNPNDAILVWGDTGGQIHTIHFNSATIALFERPSQAPGSLAQAQQTSNDNCLSININEIKDLYKNAMIISYKAHTAWVRQVKWAKHLDCVISCALTNKESVAMGWFVKKSSHIRINYSVPIRAHEKSTHFNISNGGVNGFDYDQKMNLIATANQSGVVNLFNPYVCEQPNGILKGHLRVVLAVKFMSARSQLISFSADKILRIWNVPLQICIHRIGNVFPKGPEVEVTTWFDDFANRFFISFRYTMLMLEIKPEVKDRVLSHNKPVVAVKYNKLSNQVVSLSQDGTMYVWQIESGQKIKTFTDLHGTADVTCMEFDESYAKIFTGSAEGTVKVWDFNGHNYHILECNEGQNCEISQVLTLKRRLVVMGWQRSLVAFPDNTLRELRVPVTHWKAKEEHEEDILCAAVMKNAPTILATASFDGDIVLWNSVTDMPFKHLTARKRNATKKLSKESTNSSLRSDRFAKSRASRKLSKQENVDSLADPDNELNDIYNDPEISSELQRNDFSCAITCLRFLNTRTYKKDAILMSCGGNGWVRFWEPHSTKLVAEFIAHTLVSSVIMETDESDHYLATGDVNGVVKIWSIDKHALNCESSNKINLEAPPLISTIQVHVDAINSMDFCMKNSKVYILIGSADFSVSLCDINGNLLGIFGQETHWKLEQNMSVRATPSRFISNSLLDLDKSQSVNPAAADAKDQQSDQEAADESYGDQQQQYSSESKNPEAEELPVIPRNFDCILPKLRDKLRFEETFEFENDAFIRDTSLRYNPWSKTILGKVYQETRTKKRDRKQPGFIKSEEFANWEKTGQVAGGLYGSLETVELEVIKNDLKKPELIVNSNKMFRERRFPTLSDLRRPNNYGLRSAFDEKSLFPKHLLEKEAKMLQEHKKILAKIATQKDKDKDSSTVTTRGNLNSREVSHLTSVALRKKRGSQYSSFTSS